MIHSIHANKNVNQNFLNEHKHILLIYTSPNQYVIMGARHNDSSNLRWRLIQSSWEYKQLTIRYNGRQLTYQTKLNVKIP